MPHHIRRHVPGGTYFFTARLRDRSSRLLTDEITHLRDATRRTVARYPFRIDAIAVLPSVIHTIWTLPAGDANFLLRWRTLKSLFSGRLPDAEARGVPLHRRGARGIWQSRLNDHLIRDAGDFDSHLQMIHASPVMAGLCETPQAWPHSSVHRQVFAGHVPQMFAVPDAAEPPLAPIRARTYREECFAHNP